MIYQKKYLLLLLGGFQDTEETTLALLARMGATSAIESLHHRSYKLPPATMFRSAVRVVIAITRYVVVSETKLPPMPLLCKLLRKVDLSVKLCNLHIFARE